MILNERSANDRIVSPRSRASTAEAAWVTMISSSPSITTGGFRRRVATCAVARGYMPAFNTLNIFRVPQPHSVAWVTPLAGAPRYAVTGWLRAAA